MRNRRLCLALAARLDLPAPNLVVPGGGDEVVRPGAEAEAGHRISGRRIHLEGLVGVGVGGAGGGAVEARHWVRKVLGEFGDGRKEAGFWGRVLVLATTRR